MVICLERDADLHMAQLMPLPLTVSCYSKIQIGFTFLVPADPGVPGIEPLNGCVCVCVCVSERLTAKTADAVRQFAKLVDGTVSQESTSAPAFYMRLLRGRP